MPRLAVPRAVSRPTLPMLAPPSRPEPYRRRRRHRRTISRCQDPGRWSGRTSDAPPPQLQGQCRRRLLARRTVRTMVPTRAANRSRSALVATLTADVGPRSVARFTGRSVHRGAQSPGLRIAGDIATGGASHVERRDATCRGRQGSAVCRSARVHGAPPASSPIVQQQTCATSTA